MCDLDENVWGLDAYTAVFFLLQHIPLMCIYDTDNVVRQYLQKTHRDLYINSAEEQWRHQLKSETASVNIQYDFKDFKVINTAKVPESQLYIIVCPVYVQWYHTGGKDPCVTEAFVFSVHVAPATR